MQSWYLVATKPKQDSIAEHNLIQQGYEVYRPEITRTKTQRGKAIRVVESLFPRYLFIQLCDQTQNWSPIRSTKGVLQLVRFGAKPAKVDQSIIDEIKQRVAILTNQQSESGFEKGQLLRIESGPMAGLEAIFEKADGEERIIAFMNLMGQQQVSLSRGEVVAS